MSRSTSHHQRQQQKLQIQQQQQQQQLLAQQQQQIAENEAAAAAAEMFDLFCVATTMRQVLGLHRNMCELVGLRPAPLNEFYPKLKAKIRSWKAQALWKKFDARAAHRAYAKGNACTGTRVLVIGAGPCGLRTAIEAQLLGAKVVVVEKRDRISRNNVLHLWPFVITDLRNLGAKKFYGKFCAGSIDHISIRQLQCMLLKVALLLGVEVHEGVSFDGTIEPSGDGCGWRAAVAPIDHAVSHYEFDVLIGADGKRNTLEGFKRKEFRGKLAIAITANFINKKTEAEAKAEEISGVAFIFNQSFFKELYHTTGIDLENIVYYKDETHYFVMTAKKHSLIDKGVIMQDFADPAELLAPANVNTDKLLDYAREAAEFSTKYQMPNLEFAVNHYGKPDVAMFDFTSMFAAETSCRVIVRKGFRLLQCLVGDSLLEPFWPTGSGCARGFLSSMDAAYAIKLWSNPLNSTLGVLAQRESMYRLLNQTTPENLQRDTGSYTVDPATRYPNLNRTSVNVWQVKHLIDSDDKTILEQTFMDTNALQGAQADTPVRRKRRSGDSLPLSTVLLRWICAQLHSYEFTKNLKEVSDIFTNGKVICALINRYRPDLVDLNAVKDLNAAESNELAFKILEKELLIPRVMSGKESLQLNSTESKIWLNYLEQICEVFRGEIPHVKHPKIDFSELREKYRINYRHAQPDFSKLLQISNKQNKSKTLATAAAATATTKAQVHDMVDVSQVVQKRSVLDEDKLKRQRATAAKNIANVSSNAAQAHTDTPRRAKKRRSADKAANIEERQNRLQEIELNRQDRLSKRRQQRYQQTQNFYKSLHMLQANTLLREADESSSPFEDYSIFLYRQQAPVFNDRVKELERKLLHPDRERCDIPSAQPRSQNDEQFSDRIKSMEERISTRHGNYGTDKKPKDLMRAIGKIDSSDWNVREIEKKIEQSKKTEINDKGPEKVPKWSKEQFKARQTKMAKPQKQDSKEEEKFREIDQTLKNLDKQLKEGHMLEIGERGRNKVASIAGQFVKKDDTSEEKNPQSTVVPKSSTKVALAFKKQAASEKCHFCKQTVYLMEKVNTEGLVYHRSCLKCHHCHTNLRMGNYTFDRDDPNGRFYCTQHYRLPAKAIRPVVRKSTQRKSSQQQQQAALSNPTTTIAAASDADIHQTPDKLRVHADNIAQLDMLDRGQTPERIEFENTDAISDGEPSEEHIIDEHEWSGRNFLPDSNNDSESDLSSSDESDTDSNSDLYEVANESPLGAQTLQLANDWIGKQHYTDSADSDDFYDSSDGIADDGKDDTDGEEFKKARELRREEVRLLPLPANLPTDTETEAKINSENNENKENKENIEVNNEPINNNVMIKPNDKPDKIDKISLKSSNSEKSFKSATASAAESPTTTLTTSTIFPTTKADMEKLEQHSDRKFSSEIEAISEKLYRLNHMMKMTKDIETIAKENMVKSDILKKLTLKEKWLSDNASNTTETIASKSKFDERFEKLVGKPQSEAQAQTKDMISVDQNVENKNVENTQKKIIDLDLKDLVPRHPDFSSTKSNTHNLEISKYVTPDSTPQMERKPNTNTSRSNSFKNNANSSNSPKVTAKRQSLSRTNSLKKSNKINLQEAIGKESQMEIESILDIVKKMDIKKNDEKEEPTAITSTDAAMNTSVDKCKNPKDIGRLLYDAENKFSPKPNKRMTAKMKEIETQNFAGTMDSIKSQIVMPTVSTQAASGVDLAKYFPNQKPEKSTTNAVNKNQKNLRDVDLAKYFPSSPVPQRRSNVVTVAEKLKKSQTENSLATTIPENTSTITPMTSKGPNVKSVPKLIKQNSLSTSPAMSLRDHQLDGAADLLPKMSAVKVVTTPKAKAKITKKCSAKSNNSNTKTKKKVTTTITAKNTTELSLIPHDESDQILAEILESTDGATRSPSLDYQKLFQEEKSPSDDVSDKIERILEETGIAVGLPSKQRSDNPKKLLKTKSLGETEHERKADTTENQTKEEGDRPSGVKNILKRFESLSSMNSDENIFKLRRMDSATGNMQKSRDSIVSEDTLGSISDLDKTMDYLRNEWRSEATNFLQKKRDNFYAQKQTEEKNVKEMTNRSSLNELPVQYCESKLAKFFGLKTKIPEKRKSPTKKGKADSVKNVNCEDKNKNSEHHPKTSLDELAKISNAKQYKKEQADLARSHERTDIKTPKDIKTLLETANKIEDKKSGIEFLKSNVEVTQKPILAASIHDENITVEKTDRPVVEDIRNLPKTGCDKSLNNSRRGSQTSLQSRRLSNSSLKEQLECAVRENIEYLSTTANDQDSTMNNQEIKTAMIMPNSNENMRELPVNITREKQCFDKVVTPPNDHTDSRSVQQSQENTNQEEILNETYDNENNNKERKESATDTPTEDTHLLESESKDLTANSNDLQLRGSSENESIDNLFSQFSDEMLANVEFDSNDELVAITPRLNLINDDLSKKVLVNGEMSHDDIIKEESQINGEMTHDNIVKEEPLETDIDQINKNDILVQELDLKSVQKNHIKVDGFSEETKCNSITAQESQFPIKPQRRHKSKSSSSESTAPIAPQRLKKKLAALNPNDMPPSVQDLLDEVIVRQVGDKQKELEILEFDPILCKFPITADSGREDYEIQMQSPVAELKSNKRKGGTKAEEKATADTETISIIKNKALLPHDPTIVDGVSASGLKNSIIPKSSNQRTSNVVPKIITPTTHQSKENSLEWDMEKMPASPMPRRKLVSAERGASTTSEIKLRDISPTSSIKILNNLPDDSANSEKRLLEAFEMERRQALVKRDQSYHEVPKPNLERRNSTKSLQYNNSTTNSSTSSSSKLTPSQSRRAATQDSLTSRREGTPPMFKKLIIPSSDSVATTTAQDSRRSSFAFIELENNEPIIAPMPKKLNIPKYEPKYVPDKSGIDADAEVFKNRPWPKQYEEPLHEDDEEETDEDNAKIIPKSLSRTPSPIAEVFKNRQWPDGNTDFSRQNKEAPTKPLNSSDDIEVLLAKRRSARRNKATLSQSPQAPYSTLALRKTNKDYSKSINDLQKNSPLESTYNSTQSLHKLTMPSTRSSYSSMDTDYKTNAAEQMPTQRTLHHTAYNDDANTQLLLDRGKRLHNRKRDFVNERVIERNPYMRDVIKGESSNIVDDEEISSYRRHHYNNNTTTSTPLKFPTSRTAVRSTGLGSASYDYLSVGIPTLSTHGTIYGSNRYLPTTRTSPMSHLNSTSDHLRRPITSTSSLYRRSPHRDHLLDYFKRGHNERGNSKESCVPSESESSSPDEVEHNSATEISTDSEFDNDEIIRETPRILIDDTHLRKPTKVQVKSTLITARKGDKYQTVTTSSNAQNKGGSYLQKYQPQQHQQPLIQFKPLVQVDPTLLITNRSPLQNPRQGDYLLNKTASTEGIASKKSLELKKRYLLGEPANGNKIQKSGSTSVLDSRIRNFQSNISECQKLLNPSNDISASMKTFLDRTKLGEGGTANDNELMRSATNTLLNDLKVEITIQKASSTASTDNEKENVFVHNKNELNKGKDYTETINTMLMESLAKKSPTTPTNNKTIFETIDLTTPEKETTNNKINEPVDVSTNLLDTDSNMIVDLTEDSPVKSENTIIDDGKPDVSKDVRERIPDILGHIELDSKADKQTILSDINAMDESQHLLSSNSGDEEKCDSPEKKHVDDQYEAENETLQIEVPTIPWNTRRSENLSTTTNTSCNTSCSSSSSSIEDIQHYILDSTTSPDTQPGVGGLNKHNVPRVEVHDTSGTLMQIDSLMIIDGKYVGDPDDLKYMEVPAGVIVPEVPDIKTIEVDDDTEVEVEPVTATPEPAECTVIEADELQMVYKNEEKEEIPPLPEKGPPLPEKGPPKLKLANLKFDTKNANKIESLKNLPLIVEQPLVSSKAIKPISLDLRQVLKTPDTPTTPTGGLCTPSTPMNDNDKTPTAEFLSRGSDSETDPTGTAHVFTETELSDWTADDCISENFVQTEYIDNTKNKGTIKRNKKDKKKAIAAKLPSTNKVMYEVAKAAPVAEFEGILKAIDLDDIEFMDTGSEGSCAEAYSATNTALLRNRGYVEFIETTPKETSTHKNNTASLAAFNAQQCETITVKYKPIVSKRDEKLGVDYIEQGAYIMQNVAGDTLKTPVNENAECSKTSKANIMSQSLTDSSIINDLDEDSVLNTNTNTTHLSSVAYNPKNMTTEESEALTIVSSPLESMSAVIREKVANVRNERKSSVTVDGSTPSSSEQQPKTSQSTYTGSSSNTATNSSKATSPRQLSKDDDNKPIAPITSVQRQPSEEFSYEEYVRVLQQKIAQISTARDSLDSRKQKRKSSKGEAPILLTTNNTTTVIESNTKATNATTTAPAVVTSNAQPINVAESTILIKGTTIASELVATATKVPEIPTLTRKLEEITKERTKQKDLIHDLVMDKLQSKKQLNAEKRLHRSRQRNMMTSGYTSGSSLSPTPKTIASTTTKDSNSTNSTNGTYYHATAAAAAVATIAKKADICSKNKSTEPATSSKENNPLQKSSTYVSAYGGSAISPTHLPAYKQRPFSAHIDTDQLDEVSRYKLKKTPSFSYALSNHPITQPRDQIELKTDKHEFVTPITPTHLNRNRNALPQTSEESISTSAENLRSEARARARLKSNSELGLSPEEKMQLLRKRLHYDQFKFDTNKPLQMHNERSMDARERKMSSSKSVNDLVYISNQQQQQQQHYHQQQQQQQPLTARIDKLNAKSTPALAEFTSDLILEQSTDIGTGTSSTTKTIPTTSALSAQPQKKSKRQKDPERRKSLIQSLSSFFHKSSSSSNTNSNNTANASCQSGKDKKELYSTNGSAQAECPGTSASTTTSASSSVEGMFSRFRISPKSKEKSKDIGISPIMGTTATATTDINEATTKLSHERSTSQECITTTRPYMSTNNIHTTATSKNNTSSQNQQQYIHQPHQQKPQPQQQHQQTSQLYYKNNRHNKKSSSPASTATFSSSSPQLYMHKPNNNNSGTSNNSNAVSADEQIPPPIPPLPLNYQRSDDESFTNESRDQKKQRAISKAMRQAELKRLRIAQEIEREQEEIEVQLKELEARGVLIEKALRGEAQNLDNLEIGSNDEKLLKELLEIWRNITQLKKRDEELGIRQQELQLEHRHAQLKEELNLRLSSNKLDKSSADVAAEGAILNEMLEIVAKRAALRPTTSNVDLLKATDMGIVTTNIASPLELTTERMTLDTHGQSPDNEEESNI